MNWKTDLKSDLLSSGLWWLYSQRTLFRATVVRKSTWNNKSEGDKNMTVKWGHVPPSPVEITPLVIWYSSFFLQKLPERSMLNVNLIQWVSIINNVPFVCRLWSYSKDLLRREITLSLGNFCEMYVRYLISFEYSEKQHTFHDVLRVTDMHLSQPLAFS